MHPLQKTLEVQVVSPSPSPLSCSRRRLCRQVLCDSLVVNEVAGLHPGILRAGITNPLDKVFTIVGGTSVANDAFEVERFLFR